jgi:ABC-type phosphate/phosphonate transport system substrate-binding protein
MGYSETALAGLSQSDVQIAVQLWTRELSFRGGVELTPEIVFFRDTDELEKLVKEKRVDLFSVGSLEYLQNRGRIPMRPELVGIVGDDVYEDYILLVHRASNVTQVSQLTGRKLVVSTTGLDESVPVLWLESLLHGEGLGSQDDFFSEIRRGDKTSQSVVSVFFGQADACLVSRRLYDTMAELNPQLRSDLVGIARSPDYLPSVGCFRVGCSPELRDLVIEASLTLHKHARGRQVLTLFGIKRIKRFAPALLASTVDLDEAMPGWQGSTGRTWPNSAGTEQNWGPQAR